jgi:hypothetical protein
MISMRMIISRVCFWLVAVEVVVAIDKPAGVMYNSALVWS